MSVLTETIIVVLYIHTLHISVSLGQHDALTTQKLKIESLKNIDLDL